MIDGCFITESDMARTLDLTSLRSFVAIVDAGGVTRAAGLMNLTQSAVSMQIKRLEEGLGLGLFSRTARKLALTPEGEQLLGYARKMLALNDEALARLTTDDFTGEIRLGVPHDIVFPAIPGILKRLASDYPRVRVTLDSGFTRRLKEGFARGEADLIVTTEDSPGEGAERLAECELVWIGAPDGTAWQRRPLRLAFEEACIFRPRAIAALDAAGIPWEMGFSGQSEHVMETTTAADLAVTVRMRGGVPPGCEVIEAGNALPGLGVTQLFLYDAGIQKGAVTERLKDELRMAYGCRD